MLGRSKKGESERPKLVDRLRTSGCGRIGIVGLHAGAGARATLESLVLEMHELGLPLAVTRAPRLTLDRDELSEAATHVTLPDGALLATTDNLASSGDNLSLLESTDCRTTFGTVGIYRIDHGGRVAVYGPDDPESMRTVLDALERHGGGMVLVDGGWERRGFAAPSITRGLVLVVGAGFSEEPVRSAGALRVLVEILSSPACPEPAQRAWRMSHSTNNFVALDPGGHDVGRWPVTLPDPIQRLVDEVHNRPVAAVALPDKLSDELLAPLVRSELRCDLVVRDPTLIHAAPVYLKAWEKGGGQVQVVEPVRLIAVATNPRNDSGPDADPQEFRDLVAETVPGLPVHDVRFEFGGKERKSWKLWS